MAGPVKRKAPAAPLSGLAVTCAHLGARQPDKDEIAAVRALVRQHPRAMRYVLTELCGVGKVAFSGEATHGAAFRAGSQAVGIAMAMIADVVIMEIRPSEARDDDGDD